MLSHRVSNQSPALSALSQTAVDVLGRDTPARQQCWPLAAVPSPPSAEKVSQLFAGSRQEQSINTNADFFIVGTTL